MPLALLYLATWVWGIPMAHSRIAAEAIGCYKRAVRLHRRDVRSAHPGLRFGASYAILPLVTVNHYGYQAAGLWGWGGFTVDVWYFTGTRTVFRQTEWLS